MNPNRAARPRKTTHPPPSTTSPSTRNQGGRASRPTAGGPKRGGSAGDPRRASARQHPRKAASHVMPAAPPVPRKGEGAPLRPQRLHVGELDAVGSVGGCCAGWCGSETATLAGGAVSAWRGLGGAGAGAGARTGVAMPMDEVTQ